MARIPVVASRTEIGSDRIQEAQDRRGLSDEAVARLIHVSTKTWWRWKKAGLIPTAALPAVAEALHLEFHDEATVIERPRVEADALASISLHLQSLEDDLARLTGLIEEALGLLRASPQRAARGSGSRRKAG